MQYPVEQEIKERLSVLKVIIDHEGENNPEAIKEYQALVDLLVGQKSKWKYLWQNPAWVEWKRKHQSEVMVNLWDTVWQHKRIEFFCPMVDDDGFLVEVHYKEVLARLKGGWLLENDEFSIWSNDEKNPVRIDLTEDRIKGCDEVVRLLEAGWKISKPV